MALSVQTVAALRARRQHCGRRAAVRDRVLRGSVADETHGRRGRQSGMLHELRRPASGRYRSERHVGDAALTRGEVADRDAGCARDIEINSSRLVDSPGTDLNGARGRVGEGDRPAFLEDADRLVSAVEAIDAWGQGWLGAEAFAAGAARAAVAATVARSAEQVCMVRLISLVDDR
jgi:hypothetical protein